MREKEELDLPMTFDDSGHEALVGLWWTSTLLKKVARRFFREHGFSEAQFNLLMTLKNVDGPMTQNELSRRLLVDKSNITGVIDRLEEMRLIMRKKVSGDRRSYHIVLTDEGRRRIEELDGPYSEVVAGVMAGFSTEERSELSRLTRKMREALSGSFEVVE